MRQKTTSGTTMKLSEIFTSIEGEGILFGTKTMFVRLAGCPFKCHWCDTPYALSMDSGIEYSVEKVKDIILKSLQPNTYKINFTGGEPLVQYEAVIELAKFAGQKGLRIYLESACYDAMRFAKVLPYIDICKVELKLRDSKIVHQVFRIARPTELAGFIIQPSYRVDETTLDVLFGFYDTVYPIYDQVRVVPQLHKIIGAR